MTVAHRPAPSRLVAAPSSLPSRAMLLVPLPGVALLAAVHLLADPATREGWELDDIALLFAGVALAIAVAVTLPLAIVPLFARTPRPRHLASIVCGALFLIVGIVVVYGLFLDPIRALHPEYPERTGVAVVLTLAFVALHGVPLAVALWTAPERQLSRAR